ncbi:MAG: hypothetical protein Ct9H300mP31_12920 [Acidimicrobiaceae bacterium]|nr:MAG: hypothetical protein Ct9H300mP31_12920 [Acidimicrobiaceae bacterium]
MILEIRGAEGGEEANLFARDLHEMYLALAAAHAWSIEPMEAGSPTWEASVRSWS